MGVKMRNTIIGVKHRPTIVWFHREDGLTSSVSTRLLLLPDSFFISAINCIGHSLSPLSPRSTTSLSLGQNHVLG